MMVRTDRALAFGLGRSCVLGQYSEPPGHQSCRSGLPPQRIHMPITVQCGACHGSGKTTRGTMCLSCAGIGQVEFDEYLVCSDCSRSGRSESQMVYQSTRGTTALWRCSSGHEWTQEVIVPS